MWTNDETAALIAAIEEDTLKSFRINDDSVPHMYYELTMEKCVFDLPRDWTPIAARLNRAGKTTTSISNSSIKEATHTHTS